MWFKRLILFISAIVFSSFVFATHNRAGEITYRWISGLTYELQPIPTHRLLLTAANLNFSGVTVLLIPLLGLMDLQGVVVNIMGKLLPNTSKRIYIKEHIHIRHLPLIYSILKILTVMEESLIFQTLLMFPFMFSLFSS
jgi:hypothetical protein